ncbi:MAG: L-seryl-tRNA(Sec) selenium transferase [Mycobacteriales bacterium]
MTDPRRALPRTDAVLTDPRLAAAVDRLGRRTVKAAVVAALQQARAGAVAPEAVPDVAVALLPGAATTLRPVLNATGVVLHTNLGRAPLSAAAVEAMARASGYTDVEYDLATGARAARGRGALEALAAAVPEAEQVLVVNNGAAALVLATTALAAGREVLVSRGEMVEIGDGFRLPDLITSTGARIREVGTTNRTRLEDYAVSDATGCLLKVHPSNFRIEGFTSSVGVAALAGLGVPVVVDVGSGLLRPHPLLPDEPDVATVLRDGAAVVTCSGDKLLGGPQAGLVFGTEAALSLLRRHPLYRAFRCDKTTLAALEATVRGPEVPAWQALRATGLRERAEALATSVGAVAVPSEGAVGGGGAPGLVLPGWAVALDPALAGPLRAGDPCVVGRVADGRLLLDLRCVPPCDDERVRDAVLACTS